MLFFVGVGSASFHMSVKYDTQNGSWNKKLIYIADTSTNSWPSFYVICYRYNSLRGFRHDSWTKSQESLVSLSTPFSCIALYCKLLPRWNKAFWALLRFHGSYGFLPMLMDDLNEGAGGESQNRDVQVGRLWSRWLTSELKIFEYWLTVSTVAAVAGYLVWNLDFIYCSQLHAFRSVVGIPLGLVTELHGW